MELFKTIKFETYNIYYHAGINLCLVWVNTGNFWSIQNESHTKAKMKDIKCMGLFYQQSVSEPFFSFWAWMTISCCTPWYKSATEIGSTTMTFSRDMMSVIFPPESLSVFTWLYMFYYCYNSHVHTYMVFWSTKCVQGCMCIY